MKQCVFFLLLLPSLCMAQNKLTITGKVTGIKEGQLISLTDVNRPTDTIAKTRSGNGVLRIKGDAERSP